VFGIDNLKIYSDDFWEQFRNKSNVVEAVKSYLNNYPHSKKIFILTEADYIDKDFIIDYSNYYSRCFNNVKKRALRYHFFFSEKKEEILDLFCSITADKELDDSLRRLNDRYLGFLVKKELERGSIGRTILRKYPQKIDHRRERILNVSCKNKINIFGIPLELDTLPFQEQDGAVSACATIAIWSALRVLGEKFNISIPYAPSEITNLAFDPNSLISPPKFPNKGLNIHQIISVFAKLGYNIIPYSNIEDNDFLAEMFRAYLDYGIPLIALLEFDYTSRKKDYHAVTISGYKFDNVNNRIMGLYVHDDQIGPYSKVKFKSNKLWEWDYDWFERSAPHLKKIKMTEVLVPLYPKIRQTFTAVYEETYLALQKKMNLKKKEMRIYLYDINSYKWDLITKIMPVIKNRTNPTGILSKPFPKYIWVLRLKEKGLPSTDFIFDATTDDLSMYESVAFY
jgi:hypothetical protein